MKHTRCLMCDTPRPKAKLAGVCGDCFDLCIAGAVPHIPFKINSQGAGPAAWRRMWGLFMFKQEEFSTHYHQRSNVESTFSAIKRLLGGALRSGRRPIRVGDGCSS